jgi:signal transduction histidine kinase
MRQSLRARLAVSHILPILLLMPILSLYLFYSLERFFASSLLQQLNYQARLVYDRVQSQPELTQNQQAAARYLAGVAHLTDARVVLLSREGVILASTRAEDADRIGTRYTDPAVAQALRGKSAQGVGPGFTTEVAYVVLPLQRDGVTMGALRLSYEVGDLRAQFNQLQWLVLAGAALTVILGLGLGLGLATAITRPLRQLSDGAQKIATGDYRSQVRVQSHDEVGRLAHNFNQMASRLEEAEQARERQLAAIVHELARPLTGMRAAIETLLDDADTEPEMRDVLLEGVEQELARLERLIGTLQGLHKWALRPMQLNRTETALDRVIRACAANYDPVAAQAGITLAVDVPSTLPRVQADEDRLIQVLTNLLDNAFKFTPRGGRVSVQGGENEGGVWVAVADTGAGIAPDELPHIFQQFYSGDESREPEKRGMGLGLAICREIVMAHQGQIEVESQPGHGARFTFTLPKG